MINFEYFSISSYFLIITLAFLISSLFYYKIIKDKIHSKIDIIYIFLVNILGFMIGSKVFFLIEKQYDISFYNFIYGGYRFIGRFNW